MVPMCHKPRASYFPGIGISLVAGAGAFLFSSPVTLAGRSANGFRMWLLLLQLCPGEEEGRSRPVVFCLSNPVFFGAGGLDAAPSKPVLLGCVLASPILSRPVVFSVGFGDLVASTPGSFAAVLSSPVVLDDILSGPVCLGTVVLDCVLSSPVFRDLGSSNRVSSNPAFTTAFRTTSFPVSYTHLTLPTILLV